DGPKAQQVGIHPKNVHQGQREQQTKRDHRCHHKPGSPIAQEQDHNEYDDKATEHQIFRYGEGGPSNEFTSVQKWIDIDPFGQGFGNGHDPFLYSFDHTFGIGIFQHHDLAKDFFALSIARDRPKPGGTSKTDLGHVLDIDGNAISGGHHNVFDILEASDQAFPADKIGLVHF